MNILQICSIYYGNNLFKRMFESMAQQGIKSIVYVPKWSADKPDEDVYIVSKRHTKLDKFLFWGEQKYILKDIENRIALSNIDCVYAHRLLYGGDAALKLYSKYKIPYIVFVRNSDVYGFGRNIYRFRKHSKEVMSQAHKVLFFSKCYQDKVLKLYENDEFYHTLKEKSEVIVSGVNNFFINNTLGKGCHKLPEHGQLQLISIGWIDRNKNLPTLLSACKLLIKRGYEVKLRLLGKVVNKNIFNKAISYDFVEYMGFRPQEEVADLIRNSDVFVLPSIHESFGLVYAESMTQGTPIIYTRGQGFDGQYADGEVGYSVDCFNAEEIANRIIDITQDYRNISDRCVTYPARYDWFTIVKRYQEIFDECVSGK